MSTPQTPNDFDIIKCMDLKTLNFDDEEEIESQLNFGDTKGILEQLKCPICINIPRGEIYQCRNGHTICESCKDKVNKCPQCRISFETLGGLVRVRVLESVLDLVKMPCPHKQAGCLEQIFRKGLEDHTKSCIYNGKCVQLCKKLGYDCDHWISALNSEAAVEHLKSVHNAVYLTKANGVALRFKNFEATMESLGDSDGTWTPAILKMDGATFLLLTLFNAQDKSVSWTCLNLNHGNGYPSHSLEPPNGEVDLRIENHCDKLPPLKWKMSIVSLLQLQSCDINDIALQRIPAKALVQSYLQAATGTLTLHATACLQMGRFQKKDIPPFLVASIRECIPRNNRSEMEEEAVSTAASLSSYLWLNKIQQRCGEYVDNLNKKMTHVLVERMLTPAAPTP